MPVLPSQGQISETPLARLLLSLHQDRWSGAIALERGADTKHIQLKNGAPVAAESSLRSESLCEQLEAKGAIGPADAARAGDLIRQRGCAEGAAILAMQLAEPKTLFGELKQLMRRRIIEALGWSDGQWSLDANACPPGDAQAFRVDPLPLICDGLAQQWNVERLAADLSEGLHLFPHRTREFPRIEARLGATSASEGFRLRLDGHTTLARALGSGATSPEILAVAWVLRAVGAFELLAAPVDDGDDDVAPMIEIAVAATPATALSAAVSTNAAGTPAGADGESPAATKMREEIAGRHARLDGVTHYEVLEVAGNATAAELKKAYFGAAKRYHPDTLNRLGLAEVKGQAGEVFSRISEAYEVLSKPARRAQYDALLAGGGEEIDVERLAQAETFFRKGEIMVRMGDFRGALEFLRPAVELWPSEAAYQSTLGWALFKKSPSEPDAALGHLETAVELAPEDGLCHFRLGTVLRPRDGKRAAQHLARAKQLDPNAG